eukprot:g15807.t1
MPDKKSAELADEELESLRLDFAYIDRNGNGSISVVELQEAFEQMGHEISVDEVKDLIKKADKDHNGAVEFNEFAKLAEVMEKRFLEDVVKNNESLRSEYEQELNEDKSDKVSVTMSDGIVLGPVVGKVTADTARIMVEVGKDSTLVIEYKSEDGTSNKMEQKVVAAVPAVFVLTGLQPGTKYTYEFQDNKDRNGSFRTFDPKQTQFQVIAASCDKGRKARGKANLYEKLYNEYIKADRVDLFVRHGDQVYADSAFAQGEKILLDESIPEKDKDDAILKCYKDIYRATWNEPDVRLVHANVQCLMLWDDHELRNDWGSFKQDTDSNSTDFRICTQARKAYWQYQRQLWDDIGPLSSERAKERRAEAPEYLNRDPVQMLEVTVVGAKDLKISDGTSSDPFVECMVIGPGGKQLQKPVRSKVVKNDHKAPMFDFKAYSSVPQQSGCCGGRGTFAAPLSQGDLKQAEKVRLRVYDKDHMSKNDFLGEVCIPLRMGSLLKDGMNDLSLTLLESEEDQVNTGRRPPTGTIQVQVRVTLGAFDEKKAEDRSLESECSFHCWGSFGVMMIDGRGCRSFSAQSGDPNPFIGSQQWHQLKKAISPAGVFKDVKTLTVVHSMPVVLMSTSASSKVGSIPPQLDKMGFGLHPFEQVRYLKTLDDWAQSAPDRKFILVGGDMHFAVESDINEFNLGAISSSSFRESLRDFSSRKGIKASDGRLICQQLILSAISNKMPPKIVYLMLRKFMKGHGILGISKARQKYSFFHKKYYYERNFGVITMSSDGEITPQIVVAKTDATDSPTKDRSESLVAS